MEAMENGDPQNRPTTCQAGRSLQVGDWKLEPEMTVEPSHEVSGTWPGRSVRQARAKPVSKRDFTQSSLTESLRIVCFMKHFDIYFRHMMILSLEAIVDVPGALLCWMKRVTIAGVLKRCYT